MYNEVDGDFEDVVVRTFKVGLMIEHELRKSLTMKSALNMHQLMNCINKYKRLEDDQIQGKGKAKMFPENRDSQGAGYHNDRPRRDFPSHATYIGVQLVNSLFKEPVY